MNSGSEYMRGVADISGEVGDTGPGEPLTGPGRHDPPPAGLPILWRDEHYVVVYKPSGMLVHRTAIDGHTALIALQVLRRQLGHHVYPVHRLDRPTAGLLLFATHSRDVEPLARLFRAGQVHKRYLAIVRGRVRSGLVFDSPLADLDDDYLRHPARHMRSAREGTEAKGRDVSAWPAPGSGLREAHGIATPLADVELPFPVGRYASARYSLLEVLPTTGRRHQIRRHLKRAMHPIIGDTTYGDGRHNLFFRERFAGLRLMLCAIGMSFTHPYTAAEVRLRSAPDADFLRIMTALGWHDPVRGLLEGQTPLPGGLSVHAHCGPFRWPSAPTPDEAPGAVVPEDERTG